MLKAENSFSAQRLQIIETAGEVFNLPKDEIQTIETFIREDELENQTADLILAIQKDQPTIDDLRFISTNQLKSAVWILRIPSVDLYFLRCLGEDVLSLNDKTVQKDVIYLFAGGAKISLPSAKPIYYSDVVGKFLSGGTDFKLSFNAENISFTFPNGGIGLRPLTISEEAGRLVGIMGASGAGKTTLMNVLSGIEKPTEGSIRINGYNINTDKQSIDGVIGYVPQDDLLIEELTVYQNLYFNAKLCFKDASSETLDGLVMKVLTNLGLAKTKDLKVGSPLKKTISGGQRKRLNIALELIREPSVLFVDEPTSGLSSRDSENVMELLNEMTMRGKLIFVVIHQPSSAIYKMFDKMIILDTGGYLIYNGNPIEAVAYFKKVDNQANLEIGENVNPESIFNIIEAQVVDEFGNFTGKRKIVPEQWEELFKKSSESNQIEDLNEQPPGILKRPSF